MFGAISKDSLAADGLEDVEARERCADHQAGDLRVPVDFLYFLLALVDKQQLLGHVLR